MNTASSTEAASVSNWTQSASESSIPLVRCHSRYLLQEGATKEFGQVLACFSRQCRGNEVDHVFGYLTRETGVGPRLGATPCDHWVVQGEGELRFLGQACR